MAHSYATDATERRTIPFFIAALSILGAFGIGHLFNHYHFVPPWWYSPPVDTMALYGFFYWLFDRVIWPTDVIHMARITRIPCLAGKWHGSITSSHIDPATGEGTVVKITVTIRQTWTRLLVLGQTEQSKSCSVTGNILTEDVPELSYEYQNEPRGDAVYSMHIHRGTARLDIKEDGTVLEGDYYSGRGRQNFGTIRLVRSKR